MKPFGVVGVNSTDNMWDFHIGRDGREVNRFGGDPFGGAPRRRGEPEPEPEQPATIHVYIDGQQAELDSNEVMQLDADQAVFFVDTQEDAHALAGILAKRNPHRKYLTFNTTYLYYAPPGELQRAEFNDKGLLPS